METPNLIIEFLLFALTLAALNSSASAHNKIKVLGKEPSRDPLKELVLDRIAARKDQEIKRLADKLLDAIKRAQKLEEINLYKEQEIEALEHTVGLKSETIAELLAEIKHNKALYKLAGMTPVDLEQINARNDGRQETTPEPCKNTNICETCNGNGNLISRCRGIEIAETCRCCNGTGNKYFKR